MITMGDSPKTENQTPPSDDEPISEEDIKPRSSYYYNDSTGYEVYDEKNEDDEESDSRSDELRS